MNARNIILIFVAVVVAILAGVLTNSWLNTQEEATQAALRAAQQTTPETEILVVTKDLPMGHFVVPEDIAWRAWPDGALGDAYINRSAGGRLEDQIGKVVRIGMTRGEPITVNRLVAPGQKGFVAAILAPGMRAITIPVGGAAAVSGLVFPNDRVDIVLTRQREGRNISETIFQNVRILAMGTRTDDQNRAPTGGTATIEMTPKLVEKMRILERLGPLTFALRSLAEPDGVDTTASGIDDSMPIDTRPTHTWDAEVSPMQPPLDPESEKLVVTVARGNAKQAITFKRTEE